MNNGLRFKVGDVARFVVAIHPKSIPVIGTIVEITSVGPFQPGQSTNDGGVNGCPFQMDYVVSSPSGLGMAKDYQLQRIDPPAEPATLTRVEELESIA